MKNLIFPTFFAFVYVLGFFAASDVRAQTSAKKSKRTYIDFKVLAPGNISCPGKEHLIELADAEKNATTFLALYTKKVFDGSCTNKMKHSQLIANVEYINTPSGEGRYACFNVRFGGVLDKRKSCALASSVRSKHELIAVRNGEYVVLDSNETVVKAECVEGNEAFAVRSGSTWVSSGVFEDAFQDETNSTIGALRRDTSQKALTDACRGLSR
jgi:hypothetical protein